MYSTQGELNFVVSYRAKILICKQFTTINMNKREDYMLFLIEQRY